MIGCIAFGQAYRWACESARVNYYAAGNALGPLIDAASASISRVGGAAIVHAHRHEQPCNERCTLVVE